MNPEVKQEWLKALRSGEYKQGVGYIKKEINDETLYCCLGVLCDLAAKEGVCKETYEEGFCMYDDSVALPYSVITWANIAVTERDELICRNDDLRHSFKEIADYIEKSL